MFMYELNKTRFAGDGMTAETATVEALTPRKAERERARAAAAYAYSGRAWNVFHDIFTAYEKPSVYKVSAWNDCKELCDYLGGENLVICGRSCMTFSAVFQYVEKLTGRKAVCYMTRDYTRFAYAD